MKVIGHRGARRLAVENTLEALRIALQEGADGVEFDVQRTADGELVLFHDDDLRRLCGRRGRITAMAWRDVRALDVHEKGLPDGRVAHLDQAIELLELAKATVDCELKVDAAARNGLALAEALRRKLDGVDARRWLVSSFARAPLERLHALGSPVPLAALIDRLPTCDWWPLMREDGTSDVPLAAVNPAGVLLDPQRVATWHQRGWQVWPWTLNTPRVWDKLRALQVDAAITDDPGGLRRWLART